MLKSILKGRVRKLSPLRVGVLFCLSFTSPTAAQIVPDATLPVNTLITPQGNTGLIEGGTTKGSNLFHSFDQFSVNTGGTAYFSNNSGIQNIIGRVTGNSISAIDGLLRTNGAANLFLLNPNGVIFGPNASLNLGGSFLGTTANTIIFADGTHFSATNPQPTPLLTVSMPVGIEFRGNPGGIFVQGTGHTLIGEDFRPVVGAGNSAGLRVQPGSNLVLLGGDVTLGGGLLTAPGGQIEIGSVDNGVVGLNPANSNWVLDYNQVSAFRDIRLSTRALVDASGFSSGSIQLQGRRVSLADGSVVLIQNQGLLPSGKLRVNASDSLSLSGTDPIARIPGSIRTEAVALGQGGDIEISTPKVSLTTGGAVITTTYSGAKAGDINLSVPSSVEVIGSSPRTVRTLSNINSLTFSSGPAGNISVQTGRFTAREGGVLLSVTAGSGLGGDVTVNATDSVELLGIQPNVAANSSIGASTSGSGKAGNLLINTPKLLLRDGGRVDSSTAASGPAGSITINAFDSVEVTGAALGSQIPSLIISSANILDKNFRRSFGVPDVSGLTGESGDVTINTRNLSLRDGAQITVRNDGPAKGGKLEINAKSINLDNQSGITATAQGLGGNIILRAQNLISLDHNSMISATASGSEPGGSILIDPQQVTLSNNSGISVANTGTGPAGKLSVLADNLTLDKGGFLSATTNGEGGNIQLQLQNLLLMQNNSKITAAAGGSGSGGNIDINADLVAALSRSDIIANAELEKGGKVTVTTQGLFKSPNSRLSASGGTPQLNGTVEINTPQTEFSRATAQPVQGPQIPKIEIACSSGTSAKEASFITTGPGGLPLSPTDVLSPDAEWRGHQPSLQVAQAVRQPLSLADLDDMPEAQGWLLNGDGTVRIVSRMPEAVPHPSAAVATCR